MSTAAVGSHRAAVWLLSSGVDLFQRHRFRGWRPSALGSPRLCWRNSPGGRGGLPGRCLTDATSFQPISVTTLWPTTAELKVGTFGRVLRSPVGSAARTNTSTRDVVPRTHPVLHTCLRAQAVTQGRGLLVALCPQHAGLSRPSCGSARQLPDLLCAPGEVSLPGLQRTSAVLSYSSGDSGT